MFLGNYNDNQEYRNYTIPKIVLVGRTFTDQEFARLYEVSLSTVKRWKGSVKNGNNPKTNLCSNLTKNWTVRSDGKWEKTLHGFRVGGTIENKGKSYTL